MRHRVSSSKKKKKTKEKAEWNAVSNGDLPMETVLILLYSRDSIMILN